MSVEVNKAPCYRCCNSCSSSKDVVEINSKLRLFNSTQGTQIALCKKCATELVKLLYPYTEHVCNDEGSIEEHE